MLFIENKELLPIGACKRVLPLLDKQAISSSRWETDPKVQLRKDHGKDDRSALLTVSAGAVKPVLMIA